MSMRAALILGAAFVLAALAHGGLYEIRAVSTREHASSYMVNRFTGAVAFCTDDGPCVRMWWGTATPKEFKPDRPE